jgi:lambda repressor-like predicted transcriptional regulator
MARCFPDPAATSQRIRRLRRLRVADLDAFLDRLGAKSSKAGKRNGSLRTIPDAARCACCSAAEIVRLILDGKLATRMLAGARGYMGILVDAQAVADAVRGPQPDGLSLRKASRELGTSDRALEALIAHKHIGTVTAINPVNRCPQTLVPNDEVRKFEAKYVSLWTLSKERGVYIATLKNRLDRAGVKPALDPAKIGARFCRASRPVEHPGRNLQPSPRCPTREAATENLSASLLNNLMNMDQVSGPRMPRIKKLVLSDPVGVPSSCCTTASERIDP